MTFLLILLAKRAPFVRVATFAFLGSRARAGGLIWLRGFVVACCGLSGQVCSALSLDFGWDSCRRCRSWGSGLCLLSRVGGRDDVALLVLSGWFAWSTGQDSEDYLELFPGNSDLHAAVIKSLVLSTKGGG